MPTAGKAPSAALRLSPSDIEWQTSRQLREAISDQRKQMGLVAFAEDKAALKSAITSYINTYGDCSTKHGKFISPVGSIGTGKCLKVRWGVPGCGRSGGLRLAVVAYCEERRVFIAAAFARGKDPSDAEFATAFALAK